MKKGKIGQIFCLVIWLCQLAVEVAAAVSVWRLNMLPEKYFLLLAGILAVMLLITGLLLLPGKKTGAFEKKRNRGIGRRIVGGILAIVMIVGCVAVRSVAAQVHSAVDGITGAAETVNVSMSVYVLADDPAQTIADASGYRFGALEDYEAVRTEQALAMIRQELAGELELVKYATLAELVEALYDGDVDALILNSAYVSLLEDTPEFLDFSDRTRVLYTALIEETVYRPTEPTVPEEADPSDATAPTEEPFTITGSAFIMYVSGSDTRDYYLSTSRSDVNILMVVNPETRMVLLLNTPRDYYVANPAGNGAKDKLTHCGIYGIGCSVDALELLYDAEIRYYSQINFTGLETLVDAIGGVDVYADYGFYVNGNTHWINEGWNHLDGPTALAFARNRYNQVDGDNGRGRNQMKVIQGVINKVTSGTTIIENYAGILESIQGMFKTNVTMEEIGELVKMQLGDMAPWTIRSYAVTGTGGSDITYSMPGLYCYVMYPDEAKVAYGQELIRRVLDGEVLTEEDMVCPN